MAEQAYLELTAKSHLAEQSKSWPGISDLRGIKVRSGQGMDLKEYVELNIPLACFSLFLSAKSDGCSPSPEAIHRCIDLTKVSTV
jgi:hypothetical protein